VLVIDDARSGSHFLPLGAAGSATTAITEMLIATTTVAGPEPIEVSPSDISDFCGMDLPAIGELMAPHRVRLPRSAPYRWDGSTSTAAASSHDLAVYPLLGATYEADGSVTARAFGGVRLREDDDGWMPGCTLVVTGDLFTNAALAFPGNAGFVGGLFGALVREDERVLILDRGLSGGGKTEGIGRSIAQSRLLPLVVQGGLWVAALFILIGAAFGPLRDPVRLEHKAFVEHVEAIGRHYANAGPAGLGHAQRVLARLLVMRHRHEVRGGQEAGWQVVARHLADRTDLPEAQVRGAIGLGLTSEGGEAKSGGAAPDHELLRTLSTLLSGKQRKPDHKKAKKTRR
jgi:hypothetical protein